MFGLGKGNKNEKLGVKVETARKKELQNKLSQASADCERTQAHIHELQSNGISRLDSAYKSAEYAYFLSVQDFLKTLDLLNKENEKTHGQQLSDILAGESQALQEKTERAIELYGTSDPEYEQLQEEIRDMMKEVDFLKELDIKLNNRQNDDSD